LAIVPKCRSELSSSLVRKRAKTVDVNDISLDPGAPIVDVIIDGSLINGVQVDSGSSVNLMNVDTMEELGLTSMTTTPIILRMADQSRVKPLGMLSQLLTIIGGIDYKIDYVVFKVLEPISTYPILLGRPWLYLARAKDDWDKGALTIGKGNNKIILPVYRIPYHGETQAEDTEVTTCNTYGSESESTKLITREHPIFKSIGMGEYIEPLNEEDSNTAILKWENSPVFGIITEPESEIEPPYQTDSEELIENLSHKSLPNLKTSKSTCIDMKLGTKNDPKNIRIYSGLTIELFKEWLQFFKDTKDVFAWTYKDLKGVPPKICQHQIVLESNAKPVRQRQYRMNPKYSLMVKEEIDKLLECGFIYPVPYSEWVSPIVVVPMKNGKLRICVDFCKLNFVTQKDYFPLPFTDAILDGVARHECYSFLDGFSGYNQVMIVPACRAYMTFTTDWGTFAYNVMPFGLCNTPTTFQRVMTTTFQKYLRKFIEIFLDDFCVFSTRQQHAKCLKKCFEQCREYGISINASKSEFLVPCGRLLGHIVSKEGIAVDPGKVAAILLLPIPEHIIGVKAFLGATSYYRHHIYFYAQIAAPLTYLTKQIDVPGVWTDECTIAFEKL
jgi:hypothetical protein